MAREPLEATKRNTMTPARRRAVLTRAGLCCGHLGCVMAQALEIDHIIPLELGGADDDTNLQALCHTHHKLKTKHDINKTIPSVLAGEDTLDSYNETLSAFHTHDTQGLPPRAPPQNHAL